MDARVKARMELAVPSDREIVITREFHAPRHLVFEAWTDPDHVRQWYGCDASTLVACEIDLRINGEYRYVLRMPDGLEHTQRGVYLEIVRPDRLVYTERHVSSLFQVNEAFVTVTFAERDGWTRLTSTILYDRIEDRDLYLNLGVEVGAAQTLDRLEQHLRIMD